MEKEGGRAPDYVQERTGHTRRSFSHGISHGMTLNSNKRHRNENMGMVMKREGGGEEEEEDEEWWI